MRRLTPILFIFALAVGGVRRRPPAASADGSGESSGPANPQAAERRLGGTVRIGIGGYPDSLNPGNGLLSEAYTLYELVYDTPIAVTQAGEFVPELADLGGRPTTA